MKNRRGKMHLIKLPHSQLAFPIPRSIPVSDGAVVLPCLRVAALVSAVRVSRA